MSYTLLKIKDIWHYRFQIANVRAHKSTRETDRKRADAVAQMAYDKARSAANGMPMAPTLSELIQEWLEACDRIYGVTHVRSVKTFARLHLYDMGDLPINTISTRHIERARNKHLETHSPASVNAWLRIIKLIVNWAVKREIIDRLPWRVSMLPVQKRPRATLPLESAKAWFDAIDAATQSRPTIGNAIRLMFGLGLRESEAASARWEWIDWGRKTYTPGITKGREAEPVPIMDWLVKHLAPQRKQDGLIAHTPDGKPLRPGYARHAIRLANAKCSITGITPHRLRGTFATMLSEEGVPIQTIQKVMRHKNPMTTMAYLETDLSTASKAQNRIGAKIEASLPPAPPLPRGAE